MFLVNSERIRTLMATSPDGPLSPGDLWEKIRSRHIQIGLRTIQRALADEDAAATDRTLRLIADALNTDPEELKVEGGMVLALATAEQEIIKGLQQDNRFDLSGILQAVTILSARFAHNMAIHLKGDKEGESDLSYATGFLDMVHKLGHGLLKDVMDEETRGNKR